jgi:hypothetical protein
MSPSLGSFATLRSSTVKRREEVGAADMNISHNCDKQFAHSIPSDDVRPQSMLWSHPDLGFDAAP